MQLIDNSIKQMEFFCFLQDQKYNKNIF